jgi:uncharacterized paraquat-inducible protein A
LKKQFHGTFAVRVIKMRHKEDNRYCTKCQKTVKTIIRDNKIYCTVCNVELVEKKYDTKRIYPIDFNDFGNT